MKFKSLLICFLLISTFIDAQNITGIWRGYFNSGYGNFKQQYKYEVQINQLLNNANQKGVQGVTYSYHSTVFYGKALLQGIYDSKNKSITIKETQLVELKISDHSEPCLMTCYLDYSKNGNTEILEGTFTSINAKSKIDCGSGYVYLEKVLESDFHKEDFLLKKTPANVPPQPKSNPKATAPSSSNTNANAKLLQSALGVTPDGVIGTKTIAALKAKVPDFTGKLNITDGDQINYLITQIKKNTKQQNNTIASKKPLSITPQKKTIVKPPVANNSKTNSQQKKKPSIQDTVVKTSPSLPPPVPPGNNVPQKTVPIPDVIKERENSLIKTIITNSPDILIQIYDNGEIDGDTITVYHNNEVMAYKKGLTAKPVTLNIKADINNMHHEFVMVANNLGAIPPNTALMVITTGGKHYELFISSNEKKNAKVVIDYKMPGKESK